MSKIASAVVEGVKTQCENHAECLKMIQAVLDGAATETEKAHFRENIDKCLPCLEMYQTEKCVKESLQSRISRVLCPQQLEAAIRAKLNFTA